MNFKVPSDTNFSVILLWTSHQAIKNSDKCNLPLLSCVNSN